MLYSYHIKIKLVVNHAESISDLHANLTKDGLDNLLSIFERDPTVTQYRVYTTFTVPELTEIRQLTKHDFDGRALSKLVENKHG